MIRESSEADVSTSDDDELDDDWNHNNLDFVDKMQVSTNEVDHRLL